MTNETRYTISRTVTIPHSLGKTYYCPVFDGCRDKSYTGETVKHVIRQLEIDGYTVDQLLETLRPETDYIPLRLLQLINDFETGGLDYKPTVNPAQHYDEYSNAVYFAFVDFVNGINELCHSPGGIS